MYCNTCFVSLRPGQEAVATTCGHLACPPCFTNSIIPGRRCSVCGKSTDDPDMGWRELQIPSGINAPAELLQLACNSVDTCMSLSFAAIQFKCRQEELYAKLRYDKLNQKMQSAESHYRKKIGIMNQGYEDLRVQVAKLEREKREMEDDIRELRDKYGQKAKEAMSLRTQLSGGGGIGVSMGSGGGYARVHSAPHGGAHSSGLPSLLPMGPMHARSNSHNSPNINIMPRSRSPHHAVRTLAYGSAQGHGLGQRHGSQYSTPARSSPSLLVSSTPRGGSSGHRTPPGRGGGAMMVGGLIGLGAALQAP